MLIIYLIISIALSMGVLLIKENRVNALLCWSFYVLQAVAALSAAIAPADVTLLEFFTLDRTGSLFFVLLAVVSPIVYYHSTIYLDKETDSEKRFYNMLVILLCVAITCVYFSNNLAVTWIFLEATTLCTAGLIYHRRNQRSLEATWKYIFVCSVGIAMAYLGILLMGGIAGHGGLSYSNLTAQVAGGSPLFMKIAFLFILVGYSCKVEIFPLYNIGIDANFAAPTPASALISTALVNAGFVAIYRVYLVMEQSMVFEWVSNVLIITGMISILIGSAFLRRTNQYKRLFSYSTVENMGIAMLGLGIGGIGVFAAILHVTGHTLIKSSIFLQISRVGKIYGHYRVNRTGEYMLVNRNAAALLLVTTLLLLAFPPSPLFISEIMIFKQMIMNEQWVLLVITLMMLCTVIYNLGRHIIRLCYQPWSGNKDLHIVKRPLVMTSMILLVGAAIVLGIWRPEWVIHWFNAIIF